MKMLITKTFAVALVLVLTASGLWATGAEEEPGAAAEKRYVTDPTTGKVVSAPEYGGTITYVKSIIPPNIDPYFLSSAGIVISGVNEKLGIPNWGIDRAEYNFVGTILPLFATKGQLAESWETPDDTTIVLNIRKGVHWHDKAPMNGRELTAQDIEYNFHRLLGNKLTGTEFSDAEPSAITDIIASVSFESITATDKWTVVFKLKEPHLGALKAILTGHHNFIMAREVVEQYGDVQDWRNVVGTGPFELTDYVEGSSLTYVKNPDYWGYDEKYPENRLPYVDEIRALISKEKATVLALVRSGKADYIGYVGDSQLITVDAAVSLQRTNPEMNLWPFSYRSENALTFNTQKSPWNDVRVRRAIQMAIDLETINQTYQQGWADTTPTGHTGKAVIEYITPFEEWPEELKQYYRYDPEGAEALLDEAGYPRGADGVRFQTVYEHYELFDLDYYQIVIEYLRAIGIGVEVKVSDRTSYIAIILGHKMQGLSSASHNVDWCCVGPIGQAYSKAGWNPPNVQDPVFDAIYEAAVAATTIEDQKRLVKEADMYIIEKHWWIGGPRVPLFSVTQPWVIGYNGEIDGNIDRHQHIARLWIDSELKKEMGY